VSCFLSCTWVVQSVNLRVSVSSPYSYSCKKVPNDAEDQIEAGLGAARAMQIIHGTPFTVRPSCILPYVLLTMTVTVIRRGGYARCCIAPLAISSIGCTSVQGSNIRMLCISGILVLCVAVPSVLHLGLLPYAVTMHYTVWLLVAIKVDKARRRGDGENDRISRKVYCQENEM
jgi:hypothetical protein